MNTEDGYWRFSLRPPGDGGAAGPSPGEGGPDAVRRLFATGLETLLRFVQLSSRGEPVRPDGFRLVSQPGAVHPLPTASDPPKEDRLDPITMYVRSEPRLLALRVLLGALLEVVALEAADGAMLEPDAFGLRCPADFVAPTSGVFDNLGPIAYGCNLDCVFCFSKFYSSEKVAGYRIPLGEVRARLRLYRPERGTGFPEGGNTPVPWEPFLHPQLHDVIDLVRERFPTEIIRIDNTNGSFLDEDTVRRLARHGDRIRFALSLNTSDPEKRRRIMKDHRAEVAVRGVELLSRYGLPFGISIVALPRLVGMDDIVATVRYVDQYHPEYIRINLPGFYRNSPPEMRYTHEELVAVRDLGLSLRPQTKTPLLIYPNLYANRNTRAVIEGVYRGSTAWAAGARANDCILSVNGAPALTRTHAKQLIRSQFKPFATALVMGRHFSRHGAALGLGAEWVAGQALEIEAERGEARVKYDLLGPLRAPEVLRELARLERVYDHPLLAQRFRSLLGLLIPDDFAPDNLDRLLAVIERRRSRRPLFLASHLVRPVAEEVMERTGFWERLPAGVELRLCVPENRFFGGNICIGDLLVVDDFHHAVEESGAQGREADLIILPSSPFNRWGTDLVGRPYTELEARTGIPTELVQVEPIQF